MRRTAFAVAAIAALGACKMPGERQDIGQLTHDFVYESLALSPVAATGAGYHEHHGRKLDREIDDWSLAGVREQRRFYRNFLDHLSVLNQASLNAEEKTDYRIMHDAAGAVEYHYVLMDYLCRASGGTLCPDDDASNVDWFTQEQVAHLEITRGTPEVIAKAFRMLRENG